MAGMPPAGSFGKEVAVESVTIRLVRPYRGSLAGERLTVTPALADHLERQGIAQAAPEAPQKPLARRPAVERAVVPAAVETR